MIYQTHENVESHSILHLLLPVCFSKYLIASILQQPSRHPKSPTRNLPKKHPNQSTPAPSKHVKHLVQYIAPPVAPPPTPQPHPSLHNPNHQDPHEQHPRQRYLRCAQLAPQLPHLSRIRLIVSDQPQQRQRAQFPKHRGRCWVQRSRTGRLFRGRLLGVLRVGGIG